MTRNIAVDKLEVMSNDTCTAIALLLACIWSCPLTGSQFSENLGESQTSNNWRDKQVAPTSTVTYRTRAPEVVGQHQQ